MLFRNRPSLAPELLQEALHVQLPDYTDVRIDSADLTDIQPAEYRADAPWVLGLSGVPEITDEERAIEDPELAVLSAMAHAQDPNAEKSARIALLAQMVSLGLDAERSTLYCDLVLNSLPEAARRALQAMDASKYQYQSEFARRYFGQGKAAGMVEGRVEIIFKQLARRYGAVSEAVKARIRTVDSTELDRVAERLLTARTIEEALGLPSI
jgi:hypothetical protein